MFVVELNFHFKFSLFSRHMSRKKKNSARNQTEIPLENSVDSIVFYGGRMEPIHHEGSENSSSRQQNKQLHLIGSNYSLQWNVLRFTIRSLQNHQVHVIIPTVSLSTTNLMNYFPSRTCLPHLQQPLSIKNELEIIVMHWPLENGMKLRNLCVEINFSLNHKGRLERTANLLQWKQRETN